MRQKYFNIISLSLPKTSLRREEQLPPTQLPLQNVTVCPRSLDQIYIESCYKEPVKTSLTDSMTQKSDTDIIIT